MRIADLLANSPLHKQQPPPLTCGQTVENAARRMERFGSGVLPICRRDGSVAGVISERDIVVKAVARGRAPELCTVDEVMTTRFVCCEAEDSLDRLRALFASTGVHWAVVRQRGGEMVGVIEANALPAGPDPVPAGRPAASALRGRAAIGKAPEWRSAPSKTLG
jgi:CBS domain-containing protein